MIVKGFKFGMLLQFAIGPMCLLVFNTASTYGFIIALTLVAAIALVDSTFIFLAGIGIASIINKENVKRIIKILGCIVLVMFGVNMISGTFGAHLLPSISLFSNVTSKNIFVQGVLLTASNPLTIIFWGGVFSTQIIENKLTKYELILFGLGCVMSTLFFLTIVAFFGTVISAFLSQQVIKILNVCVGIILIYFGIKLLVKK